MLIVVLVGILVGVVIDVGILIVVILQPRVIVMPRVVVIGIIPTTVVASLPSVASPTAPPSGPAGPGHVDEPPDPEARRPHFTVFESFAKNDSRLGFQKFGFVKACPLGDLSSVQ